MFGGGNAPNRGKLRLSEVLVTIKIRPGGPVQFSLHLRKMPISTRMLG